MDQAVEEHLEKRQSLNLALEKARYEASRAQRQYNTVDPENRLVAGELESRWNHALTGVAELERELHALEQQRTGLSKEQKSRLLELGNDLTALWNHPAAPDELKKRILRTVLEEIIIDNDDRCSQHVLQVHWKGGIHTELHVRRSRPGQRRNTTSQTAMDLIRELSKVCSDQAIAATLNRLGYRTGAGQTWRLHSVYNTRHYHGITNHRTGNQWLTIEQAAQDAGVSHTVIKRLIQSKILPAHQVVASTPWIIARADLSLPGVQAEIEAVRRGRRQPPKTDHNQNEFPFESGVLLKE